MYRRRDRCRRSTPDTPQHRISQRHCRQDQRHNAEIQCAFDIILHPPFGMPAVFAVGIGKGHIRRLEGEDIKIGVMRRVAVEIRHHKLHDITRSMGIGQHLIQIGAFGPPVHLHQFVQRDKLHCTQSHAEYHQCQHRRCPLHQPAYRISQPGCCAKLPRFQQHPQAAIKCPDQQRINQQFRMTGQHDTGDRTRADRDPWGRGGASEQRLAADRELDHHQQQRQPDHTADNHRMHHAGDEHAA